MTKAVIDIVHATDKMTKKEIATKQFRGFALKMKLLRKYLNLKTTKFGMRPIY